MKTTALTSNCKRFFIELDSMDNLLRFFYERENGETKMCVVNSETFYAPFSVRINKEKDFSVLIGDTLDINGSCGGLLICFSKDHLNKNTPWTMTEDDAVFVLFYNMALKFFAFELAEKSLGYPPIKIHEGNTKKSVVNSVLGIMDEMNEFTRKNIEFNSKKSNFKVNEVLALNDLLRFGFEKGPVYKEGSVKGRCFTKNHNGKMCLVSHYTGHSMKDKFNMIIGETKYQSGSFQDIIQKMIYHNIIN
jgi:hypothetical protein